MISRRTTFPAALASALLLPLPALAAPPSFDCAAATLAVERAICRSAKLSALDVEIARAYGAAMKALAPEGREVLRGMQRMFVEARNVAFGSADEDLGERLSSQAGFLKRVAKGPRAGLEGAWWNGLGTAEVKRQADGGYTVALSASEPVRSRWICDAEGTARLRDGKLTIGGDDLDGWTITLERQGAMLSVAAAPPSAKPGAEVSTWPPFCGHNGTVDGRYIAVEP